MSAPNQYTPRCYKGTATMASIDCNAARGKYDLGIMVLRGEGGYPQNEAEAARLFYAAAQGGCRDALSMLGLCYEEGRGVAKSPEKAAKCFHDAAVAGLGLSMKIASFVCRHPEFCNMDFTHVPLPEP